MAGKASRTRRKIKRRMEKNNRKDAMRALYQSYRDSGRNSKRSTRRIEGGNFNPVDHPNGTCGNIGCCRCNAAFNERFRVGR